MERGQGVMCIKGSEAQKGKWAAQVALMCAAWEKAGIL